MYERFYALRERPFDGTPAPRYTVVTEAHREALNAAISAISSQQGVALLGDAGTGKTTLIQAAIHRQTARVHALHLPVSIATADALVQWISRQCGLKEDAHGSLATVLPEIETLLRRRRDGGEVTALVIDDAQGLSPELFDDVSRIAGLGGEDRLLGVVVAARPSFAATLDEPALAGLQAQISARFELRPLDTVETFAYIAGRIRTAGGQPAKVFTREAVSVVHQLSRGIPRAINQLAHQALVAGFIAQQSVVTAATVRNLEKDSGDGSPASPLQESDSQAPSAAQAETPTPEPAPPALGAAARTDRRRFPLLRMDLRGSSPERPPLRIACDMDGTLADMTAALEREAVRLFGAGAERPVSIPPQSAADEVAPSSGIIPAGGAGDGATHDLLGTLSERQISQLWAHVRRQENFWTSLREIEAGTVARLAELTRHHHWEVIFLTQRPATAGDTVQRQTQRWLEAHGFELPSVYVVNGSRGSVATALSLDVVIDDQPENCLDVATESSARALLVWRDVAESVPPGAARLGISVVFSAAAALDQLPTLAQQARPRGLLDRFRSAAGI